ncbi:hypothetical protein, partial [Streptomyces viridosporus]|uniref:hypothetical protein n=1 Tax=Streptomyces viridosporus TaxID=67581 RepID=UPI0033323DFA
MTLSSGIAGLLRLLVVAPVVPLRSLRFSHIGINAAEGGAGTRGRAPPGLVPAGPGSLAGELLVLPEHLVGRPVHAQLAALQP